LLGGVGRLLRRRWRLLLVFALLLGAAGAAAGPHVWAWRHLAAARAALERYHADEARPHLDACLAVWPDSVEARLLASRAARLDGDFETAERHLKACQRLDNKASEETTLEWSMLHAAAGDLDEVEGFLRDFVLKNPDQAGPAREALAEGYIRLYRIRDALDVLQEWLTAEPNQVQALVLRGNLYWQIGALPKAAEEYRRVVELDADRPEARERLGIGLLEGGRYEEALKYLEQTRRWKPDDPDLEVRIARCLARLDRPEEAKAIVDAILSRRPDHGPSLLQRGQMADNAAEAEVWQRRAVRAMPDNYQANWALYESLQKQGKTDEAQAQFERAEALKDRNERFAAITTRELAARPRDPALQCELGKLLLAKGSKDLGERWLLNALRLDPRHRPALEALATYYQEQGNEDKAARYRAEAQAAPPLPPPSPGP
jgi:tetratricopeptide (TPR) repeat protein